jgi:amidase
MTSAADLLSETAVSLSRRLARREISATELTLAAINRIERLDGDVNAVVVRDFERALSDARSADDLIARGQEKPLLGVPMTVKESFDLTGHPTTWGFVEHAGRRATRDALAVRRLKAAGAVILGKTNVPPALGDWQSANPVYGRTCNPYDPSRTPGGSSGGSAAALAMRYCALELGSDIGGSIRVPAAFCGVFGLKTTYGIIPMAGHAPGPDPAQPPLLSVLGPLARSAEDLALALDVLAGPDSLEPATLLQLPPPRATRLQDLRVLVLSEHPAAAADQEGLSVLDDMARELEAAGALVARGSELLPDLIFSWKTYQAILHTITSRRVPNGREPITAHAWLDRLDDQMRIRLAWADFFRSFDIVLAPVFGTAAFPHTDEPDWRLRRLLVNDRPTPYGDQLAWPGIATVANLPAVSVPAGLGREGLPLAVQIIGPYLEDRTVIAAAAMLARATAPPAAAL